MRPVAITLLLFASLAFVARAQSQSPEDDKRDRRYNSVLWTQVSPEYAVAVKQTYRMAKLQLTARLADKNHSADEVQRQAQDFAGKPPAIILDVDETVLDNSAYNARNIQDHGEFAPLSWNAWIDESAAPAIPGAVDFIKFAESEGVKVFLVSNRRDKHVDATHVNLKQVGLDVPKERLLFRNDEAGRGGSKITRRAMVAEDYRIVLLVGDNIADLCADAEDPKAALGKMEALGSGWVMLPNAMYGGWERSGRTLRTQRTSRPVASASVEPRPSQTVPIGTPAPVVQLVYELRYCPVCRCWYYAPTQCPR